MSFFHFDMSCQGKSLQLVSKFRYINDTVSILCCTPSDVVSVCLSVRTSLLLRVVKYTSLCQAKWDCKVDVSQYARKSVLY